MTKSIIEGIIKDKYIYGKLIRLKIPLKKIT